MSDGKRTLTEAMRADGVELVENQDFGTSCCLYRKADAAVSETYKSAGAAALVWSCRNYVPIKWSNRAEDSE